MCHQYANQLATIKHGNSENTVKRLIAIPRRGTIPAFVILQDHWLAGLGHSSDDPFVEPHFCTNKHIEICGCHSFQFRMLCVIEIYNSARYI